MRSAAFLMVFLLCFAAAAVADVYIWKDESGKRYVTGKIDDVPAEYRDRVEVIKSGKAEEVYVNTKVEEEPKYGGETFEWWKNKFEEKKGAVRKLKEVLALKKLYIDVYERGWAMRQLTLDVVKDGKLRVDVMRANDKDLKTVLQGQLYSPEEVDLYNNFKKEVSSESDELKTLEDELWTLERDAKYYGVPYEAWR